MKTVLDIVYNDKPTTPKPKPYSGTKIEVFGKGEFGWIWDRHHNMFVNVRIDDVENKPSDFWVNYKVSPCVLLLSWDYKWVTDEELLTDEEYAKAMGR